MNLLNSALGDLAGTFQRNRALRADEDERRTRTGLDREMMALRLQEHGLRREDAADARSVRREGLQAGAAHQKRLEELAKEGNADKRAKMGLDFLAELNKSGQLTDEGLKAMEGKFGEMLGGAGIGVKLFRAAETKGVKEYQHPRTKREFISYGNTLLPADEPTDTITEEIDELSGEPKRKVTRRVKPGDLEAAMKAGVGGASPSGPTSIEERIAAAKRGHLETQIEEQIQAIGKGDPGAGLFSKSREQIIRDLQGKMPGAAAAQPPQFPTEAAARAAGHKAGDVVRLMLNGRPTLVRLK